MAGETTTTGCSTKIDAYSENFSNAPKYTGTGDIIFMSLVKINDMGSAEC
jgi:hypothetical protein